MTRRSAAAPAFLLLLLCQCDRNAAAQDPGQAAADRQRVHLCISGELQGKLEPCGCASGQLGGLARRAFQQGKGQYDLRIEGGNLTGGSGELDFLKFYKAAEILGPMAGYDAFGVGPRDLELKYADWSSVLGGLGLPVIASDLECADAAWPAKAFVEKPVGEQTVRIVSLTTSLPPNRPKDEPAITLLSPERGYARGLQGAADATLRIVLVHADANVCNRLAGSLQPPPDLLVGITDDHHEPPGAEAYVGKVPVVFPGVQGRMLLDLTLARLSAGPRLGYHIVRLEGSKTTPQGGQDANVREAIRQHRLQVKDDGILQKMAGKRATDNGARFVGSEACGKCHAPELQSWNKSKHAAAWTTLVQAEADPKRYGWPVTAYPDCVGCHTVGYGQVSGFVDAATTPQLAGVGCENCHGAGSQHVAAPETVQLGKVGQGLPSKLCTGCHDPEQSPDFDYTARWQKIAHGK